MTSGFRRISEEAELRAVDGQRLLHRQCHFGRDRDAQELNDPTDYADPAARLRNRRTCSWMHRLGEIISEAIRAGLSLHRR